MSDYAATRAAFTWEEARGWLEGLPGGGLDIAHEAVDRHAAGPRGAAIALRWLGKRGELDLDSMDALNLLTAIARTLGVEVPERDEAHTHTLDDLVGYVSARLPAR